MSKIISAARIEEIINILYALVCPMLGSHSCIKCISQADSDVFTTDVETLISALDFEPACVELLIEILESHKKQYKRGTKSLLFMITRLAKSVFLMQHQGIPTEVSLKIIHHRVLELTEAVEELTRTISIDRPQFQSQEEAVKEKETCASKSENEKEKLVEFKNSQSHAMFRNKDSDSCAESHTSAEGEEKVGMSQIFSLDFDGFENIDIDNGAVNSITQSKLDDGNTELVDYFFADFSPDIKAKSKIKSKKAEMDSRCSLLNKDPQVFSKPDTSSEVNSPKKCVNHEAECVTLKPKGKYHSPIDINDCVSTRTTELSINHQNDNQPAPPSLFSYQHLQVTIASLPSCESNKPGGLHKTTQNANIVKERYKTGHNSSSISSINQMLIKLGTPKLKPSVFHTSRHLQQNLATCAKQDAQSNASHDPHASLSHDLEVRQETVSDLKVSNDHTEMTGHQIHFPQELLYLDSCHLEMMHIVKQLYVSQLEITKESFFNPNLVDCLHVPVSPSRVKASFLTATTASVYPGLIIACKTFDPTLFDLRENKSTLLVNADLTPFYRHKGYKSALSKKNLVSRASDIDEPQGERSWDLKILNIIKQLKVTLILVRGQARDQLVNMCSQIGVAILTNVPYKTLSVLASHHRVEMLNYMENFVLANVCSLCLEPFTETWMHKHDTLQTKVELFYFYVSNTPVVQTVVLSSPCAMSSQLVEERLWKCLHAVANAVTDGRLLPGAGETELWCSTRLKKVSDTLLSKSCLESVVVEYLADVFWAFSNQVKMNSLAASGSSAVTVSSTSAQTEISILKFLDQTEKVTAMQAGDSLSSRPKSRSSHDTTSKTLMKVSLEESAPFNHPGTCKGNQFDNYQSKLALWVTAVDIVCMLVSLGSSMLTGVTPGEADF